jgi:hypothetical protein
VGALIARAICKKFTVSHTLLSGRPSRVCALPALRGHCADCGLCGLAGLRSPVCARGPFRRFAPTREPRGSDGCRIADRTSGIDKGFYLFNVTRPLARAPRFYRLRVFLSRNIALSGQGW